MDILGAFGNKMLEALLPTLASAAAAVAVAVLVNLFKKIGLDVDEKQRAKVKETVRDAILAVEESARVTPMPPAVKHATAVEIVKAQLPKADPVEVELAIRSTLPEVRSQLGGQTAIQRDITFTPDSPGTFGRPKTAEELSRSRHFDKGDRGPGGKQP